MTSRVLVFAGTHEGREVCRFLCENGVDTTACVATDYGSFCLTDIAGLTVLEGRLDQAQMAELMPNFTLVVDASHPYAVVVSENIKRVCPSDKLLRVVRQTSEQTGKSFEDFSALFAFLNQTSGNILLTTGSKDLKAFQAVEGYQERVYARILPSMESLQLALDSGVKASHILCMQGPFSVEMNVGLLHQTKASFLVSKDTGTRGGYPEKVEAVNQTGATLLTVGRPTTEEGLTLEESREFLREKLGLTQTTSTHFPLFYQMAGKRVLVVGGGRIGARRIATLLPFGAEITVVSPTLDETLQPQVTWHQAQYHQDLLDGIDLVLATTNNQTVNAQVVKDCRARGILVNTCDDPQACDFYFPAVITGDKLLAGLVSKQGNAHRLVKQTAEKLRELL